MQGKVNQNQIIGKDFVEHTERYKTYLEERLDLAPLLNLLLGHALGHQTWVPVDAGDECVSEGLVGSTIVVGFDNDGLAASKASG